MGVATAVLGLGVALICAPAARAGGQGIDASGTGAGAVFTTSQSVDGIPLTATVSVNVNVPADPSQPAVVLVDVKEVNDATGAVLYSGRGSGSPDSYDADADLSHTHLQAEITTSSATSADQRVVRMNIVWNADGALAQIKFKDSNGGSDGFAGEKHTGDVRTMSASGVCVIYDPADSDHVVNVNTSAPASAWHTTDTAKYLEQNGPIVTSSASSSALQVSATATTGYWSGYWTWYPATQTWKWTWVWNTGSGGYVTS